MKDIEDKTYTGEEVKDLLRKRARTRTARLRTAIASAQQKRGSVYAPKVVEEDPLTGKYANIDPRTGLALIQPKFDFFTLKRIAEESDAVSALIDVMRKNIEGFGFGLRFLGKDLDAKKPENDKNRVFLEDFFKYCNDSESFVTITSKKRFDMEQIGSGAMEVIRAADKKTIAAIYHLPMHFIRATTQDKEPTTIVYPLRRAGVVVNVPYVKYFRRFVQISPTGVILRYYKEYGDPRTISAATGEVISADAPAAECATEIILDTIYSGNYLYGLPRWLGAIMDVLGRRNAQTVNWDLFESQGIPRLMVMVSGGTLTEESYGALEELLMEARGIANYNKVTLLEANSDSLGLDDRTNTARIDFKNLSEARQDDLMFTRYLEYTAKSIRSCFRIPPLLLGLVDEYCHFEDTETLTEDGWLYHDEVGDRKIAVVDPATHELTFEKPNALHVFESSERDLFHFKAQAVDCMVSGAHGMYGAFAETKYPKRADRPLLWKRFLPPEIYSLNYRRRLNFLCAPESYAGDNAAVFEKLPIPDIDLFLEFLGFAIADAHITPPHKWPSHQIIRFTIKKERKKKEYTRVCKQLEQYGAKVSIHEMKADYKKGYIHIDVHHDKLWKYFSKNCLTENKEKKLPDWYYKLSAYYSDLLLYSLVFGDGSQREDYPSCYYATTSKVLADQVQVLGMLSGHRARLTEREVPEDNRKNVFIITLAPTITTELRPEQITIQPMTGKVFCFDVGDRLFVTRRNGMIGIHFNSLANSRAAMAATESQVFIPERIVSDEIVNRKIVQSGFGIHDWAYYNKSIRITGTEEASLMMKAFSKTGAFTINHAIALANESFGLSMSLFDEPWANYPYDIIMELLRVGRLKDLDTVAEKAIQNNAKELEQYQQNNNIGDIDDLNNPQEYEAKKVMRNILPPTEFTLYDTMDKLRKCLAVLNVPEQEV